DGQTLNTVSIEKAINACNAAGGGTVLIPQGLWLTGPIELKSNVNLHANRGALVIFSKDHAQYPMIDGRTKLPLSGNKLENVGITGEGIYDGGGDTWRPLKKSKAAPSLWADLLKNRGVVSNDGSMYWPTKEGMAGEEYLKTLKGKTGLTANDYLPARDFLRPVLVSITNSKNVLIDGPTFKNSPQFALNPKYCTNMIIRNVTINNEYYAQNGDGIDLSSCKNTIVYHCTVNAGDDGICMKSSGNKGNADTDPALENVIIADCIVNHAHGGFVIGSNTDGGMKNVYVTNCNFVNTDIGIRIKSSRDRGGLVHSIYIDNIYMYDILNEAILFNTYYEDAAKDNSAKIVPVTARTPRFQDFYINHVYCSNAKTAIAITGLPEMPVNHIYLADIVISATEPFSSTDASDISLKNVKIFSAKPTLMVLNNTKNITIDNIDFNKSTSTLISANGVNTSGIKIMHTNLQGLTDPVKLDKRLDKKIITIQ
ncbi:MAG: glycoside hydrolase family 28 protein, partial [Mucilaginibacter sp.]|nr:glycoside hydrolase family 28 protein [Mucilaginibacter sp.]